MSEIPELIVMLTHNDRTVKNAYNVFEQCRNSSVRIWGCKEEGLSLNQMKQLFANIKACGKTTLLEVVAYTEAECMCGAEIAVECGCDFLMGTKFFDSIMDLCKKHGIKYMPFVGDVSGRPSVLDGTIEDMIAEAKTLLDKGVYGIDLLGYRFTGDAVILNQQFISAINAPVCLAGSINTYARLDEVKTTNPWAFTIGSAFFDNKFNGSFCEQIDSVCKYMRE